MSKTKGNQQKKPAHIHKLRTLASGPQRCLFFRLCSVSRVAQSHSPARFPSPSCCAAGSKTHCPAVSFPSEKTFTNPNPLKICFAEKENSGWLLLACLPPSHLPLGKANIFYYPFFLQAAAKKCCECWHCPGISQSLTHNTPSRGRRR
jgi:hypothetical protein